MDAELKQKWVAALRSGKYVQGQRTLKRVDRDGQAKHCCLGVLGEVLELEQRQEPSGRVVFGSGRDTAYLSTDAAEVAGLDLDAQMRLADLNDIEHLSFDEIADYIDQNL